MVSIKVSEKTLELLKCLKEEEQIKTLDELFSYECPSRSHLPQNNLIAINTKLNLVAVIPLLHLTKMGWNCDLTLPIINS